MKVRITQILFIILCVGILTFPVDSTQSGGSGQANPEYFTGKVTITDSATSPPANLTERSSAPSSPSSGDIYLDDGTNCTGTNPCLRRYTGVAWEEIGNAGDGGGIPNGFDSIVYEYKDTGTITIQAYGQICDTDGDPCYEVGSSDVDVDFGDLDTGSEAASTLYYIWIDESGFKLSLSATSPTGMSSPLRVKGSIYNDSSSNILPFYIASGWYWYDVEIDLDSTSNTTQLYANTLGTSFIDIDCSAIVPEGARQLYVGIHKDNTSAAYEVLVRKNGSSSGGYEILTEGNHSNGAIVLTDASSIFEGKTTISMTVRIVLIGFSLRFNGVTGSGGENLKRWTAEKGAFSRTDDDTINITTDDCIHYPVGTPIRYSADKSTWYYGIVTGCTDNGSNIDIDIDGVPFSTARDDYLEYGIFEVLREIQLVGIGNCSVSSTWFPKYLWSGQDAYLVRVYLFIDTSPTGSALNGNIECNGNNGLDTEWSIAAAGSSTDSGTTVDDSTYGNAQISQDEFIEIDVSQCGSSTPGANAWAKLIFIVP